MWLYLKGIMILCAIALVVGAVYICTRRDASIVDKISFVLITLLFMALVWIVLVSL